MKWVKLGRIFAADRHSSWMHSHAMIPLAMPLGGDRMRIFFSPRDDRNRGHGGYLEINMRDPLRPTYLHPTPVLEPGELGCFDDSGALPNALVRVGERLRLYYTGINLGVTVKIRNAIGFAEWNEVEHRFLRLFRGPILDRTRDHPHFVATPEVMWDGERFRAWFTSCVRWEDRPEGPQHFYNLEYAESDDGVTWSRDGTVAIDFAGPEEYALGVPRVARDPDRWRMWFCSRATPIEATYRIRYAESEDGRRWTRHPMQPGLDVSESGWDSEMICYPFVFDHNGERYMLYNGNGFGKTGFGIAVLDRS